MTLQAPKTPLDAVKHWRNKNNMIITCKTYEITSNHWKGKTYFDAPASSCGLLLWQQMLSYLRGKYIELLIRQWSEQRRVQNGFVQWETSISKRRKRAMSEGRRQSKNVFTPPSEKLDSTMVQTKVGYRHTRELETKGTIDSGKQKQKVAAGTRTRLAGKNKMPG